MEGARLFCMCCGEQVPVTKVERHGKGELTCALCGFTLEIDAPAPDQRAAVPCIITVDDAQAHRVHLQGLLERTGLAKEVVALHSGAALVSVIAARFADNQPVDLVILDVEMPAIDGFTAARFLRSVEQKMRRPPVPIIFFTGRKADENLRRQMAAFRPAWYCAKGVDGDLAAFERRATALIALVTGMLAKPAAPPPVS